MITIAILVIIWILIDIDCDTYCARVDAEYEQKIREIERKYDKQREERRHKELVDAMKKQNTGKKTYKRSITDSNGVVLAEEVIEE